MKASPKSETDAEEHATLRASKDFQDQLKHLQRTRDSFIKAFLAITLYSSRTPYLCRKSLLFSDAEDILQSTTSYAAMVPEGVLNVTRRELRYILETVCTHYYVDSKQFDKSLEERVSFLHFLGRQPKIDLLTEIDFMAFSEQQRKDFGDDISQLYSLLCEFVHPSAQQLEERIRKREAGRFSGFEGVEDLRRLNRDIFRTLDIVLAVYLHALSLPLAGDIFIQLLDDDQNWKFHKGRWCSVISHYFDYKHERQTKPTGPRE
jgi:hypothetical protein